MKKSYQAILFTICGAILDPCLVKGLTSDPTLSSLVKTGLEKSLSLQSQNLKLKQASNRKLDSYAAILPSLALSGGRAWSRSESETSAIVEETSSTSNSLKLSSTWNIWDHGANIRKILTSKIEEESERLNTDKEKQVFIYTLIDQYLDYILQVRQRDLGKRYLEQSNRTFEEAKIMVEAGAKTQIEAMDSEISAMDAERSLLEAEASMKNSERSLRAILNIDTDEQIPIIDILEVNPYYKELFEKNYSQIKAQQPGERVASSREDRIYRLDIDRSLIDLNQTRWNYWPQVRIGASHEWDFSQQFNDQSDGTSPTLQSSAIYLSLNWSVFDWFTSTRSLQSSDYDFQIKNNSYLDAKRKAQADSDNSIDQYEILKKSVESSKLSLMKSKRQLENSRELHRLGRVSLMMMQQSTNRYFEAEAAYANRLKSFNLTMAQILIKSGFSIEPQ